MGGVLTPIEIVRQEVAAALQQLSAVESVSLQEAIGRIAAQSYSARENLPATANAAVDGYAVRASELAADPARWFEIEATVRAGHPHHQPVSSGFAAAVYTGAVMPEGPDAVFMHEDCLIKDGKVQFGGAAHVGQNIRPAGENLHIGETILAAGQTITSQDIGQLAAAGLQAVDVRPRLSVQILSTGDEVVGAGQEAAGTAQIADANGPMLQALLTEDGHDAHYGGIVADDRAALSSAFKQALALSDVLITTGGASDGIEDHTQAAMQDNDIACLFWRIAMKPGRPMAVGMKEDKLVICLPGNPVAVFVCYRLLVSGWLSVLQGGADRPHLSISVPADFHHKKKQDRAEYLRVRLEQDENHHSVLRLHGRKGAGVISSLQGADGLVEIPLDCAEVAPGDMLRFLPFRERGL